MKENYVSKLNDVNSINSECRVLIRNYFISKGNALLINILDKGQYKFPLYAHKLVYDTNENLYLFSELDRQLYDMNSEDDITELFSMMGISVNTYRINILKEFITCELPMIRGIVLDNFIHFSKNTVPQIEIFDGRNETLRICPDSSEMYPNGYDNLFFKKITKVNKIAMKRIDRNDSFTIGSLVQSFSNMNEERDTVRLIKYLLSCMFLYEYIKNFPAVLIKCSLKNGVPLIMKFIGAMFGCAFDARLENYYMEKFGIKVHQVVQFGKDLERISSFSSADELVITSVGHNIMLNALTRDNIIHINDFNFNNEEDEQHFLLRAKINRMSLLNDVFAQVQDMLKLIQHDNNCNSEGEYVKYDFMDFMKSYSLWADVSFPTFNMNKTYTIEENLTQDMPVNNEQILVKLMLLWIEKNEPDRFILNSELRDELIEIAEGHEIQFTVPEPGSKWGKYITDRRSSLEEHFDMKWKIIGGRQKVWNYIRK